MKQVVKHTDSAVYVTDSLATVLDWVSIEKFSGFTLIIANIDTGMGEPVIDVQIDTSPDGGATVNTDQHGDLFTSEIGPDATASESFDETAAYIRVRAVTEAAGETSVKATLLADSTASRICTLQDVRNRLGIAEADTDEDAAINTIISGLEGIFDNYTGRHLIQTAADVTEYYTGTCPYLKLLCYPVIEITSVKESWDYNFDNTAALTANIAYRLLDDGRTGILFRAYGSWLQRDDAIQVIYRGGYCPAGQAPAEGERALPAELREAAIEQATFLFKRRDDIGLTSVGYDGGSVSKFSAIKLLPQVREILDTYKRRSL